MPPRILAPWVCFSGRRPTPPPPLAVCSPPTRRPPPRLESARSGGLMLLSKRTQYGIRALVCFAEAYERGYLQARELSKREKLPPKFLESILNALTRADYLVSK